MGIDVEVLSTVSGIGSKTINLIKDEGFEELGSLREAGLSRIKGIKGIGDSTARDILKFLDREDLDEVVSDYRHDATRTNNPEVGLSAYEESDGDKKTYEYDPHLDPQLQWSGKSEHTSFDIDSVSLHIHERISTEAIIDLVRKNGARQKEEQIRLFEDPQLPLDEAVEFYEHEVNWSNRLILGDSLLVMNSLLEREQKSGQVQTIYIDPPYGINYKSNFQPSIDNTDPSVQNKDQNLTREPEQIKAYRDTWELGIHSYLTYLRDRLLLSRKLLKDTGSIFVQMGEENMHHVRELMDEIFGAENFIATIAFSKKTMPLGESFIFTKCDYILWYGKNKENTKFNTLYKERGKGEGTSFNYVETENGQAYTLNQFEKEFGRPPNKGEVRYFSSENLVSSGRTESCVFEYEYRNGTYSPAAGKSWKTNEEGMAKLEKANRLFSPGSTLRYKFYFEDYPIREMSHMWMDTQGASNKQYVVQTPVTPIARCILMSSDPGDLVFDPTCGSGATAYCAEQYGRRWITCDTSRVSLAIARQRLLTASFPYYKLAHPDEGVNAGFEYEKAAHVTLGDITANDEINEIYEKYEDMISQKLSELESKLGQEDLDEWEIPDEENEEWDEETKSIFHDVRNLKKERQEEVNESIRSHSNQEVLVDRPKENTSKVRVAGPFTVESIPQPSIVDPNDPSQVEDSGMDSSEVSDFIYDLKDQLLKTGIQKLGGGEIHFDSVRLASNDSVVQLEAQLKNNGDLYGVSIGPKYGPITTDQIETAANHARGKYDGVIFLGFEFDGPAQNFLKKDLPVDVVGAIINPDVLVGDLLETKKSSQIFSVFGQADVSLIKNEGHCQVEVKGIDIYDPQSGQVESSSGQDIAAWFLDENYDERAFNICQAFFPSGDNPWRHLAKELKTSIPPEIFDDFQKLESLPFEPGEKVGVKVIDHRGNEMMEVIEP